MLNSTLKTLMETQQSETQLDKVIIQRLELDNSGQSSILI